MSGQGTQSEVDAKSKKHVLIVYAHQRSGSFNGALLQTAVDTLTSCGHTVVVSDLYAIKFDPVARLEDFEGKISEEVKMEVDKVNRADLVIFQFPLYWYAMPAIMKGWLDRVVQCLSAFVLGGDRQYKTGHMKGKKALLSFTTGDNKISQQVIDAMLMPIQNGALYYVGFDVLAPQVTESPETTKEELRKQALANWSTRLSAIFDEQCLQLSTITEWSNK